MKLIRSVCLTVLLPLSFSLTLPAQIAGGGARFVAQAEHLNTAESASYLTAAAHHKRAVHHRYRRARSKKKSAAIIGGSALGGAAVGGLVGGGKGAAIGAGAGAGGGYLYDRKTNNRNQPH